MAKKCDIFRRMDKGYFYKQQESSDIERKFLTEILPLLEAHNFALIDEKRISNHMKITNSFNPYKNLITILASKQSQT